MANHNKPPFRADHVGSLLRPKRLVEAREKMKKGELSTDALKALEDEAVREVVKMQEEIGLHGVTDGDFRRDHWWVDFIDAIDGVAIEGGLPIKFHNAEGDVEYAPPKAVVKSKLGRSRGITTTSFAFLKSVVSRTAKLCVPSPTLVHFRGGRNAIDKTAYPEMETFFDDLARVYNDEFQELKRLGGAYVQIDDTNLAFLCDPRLRENTVKIGEDPDKLPEIYAKLINQAIAGLKPEMTVCMHLCRGNYQSSWVAEGGYEPVAEVLFNAFDVDGFFLEYDSPRAGDFAPLRFVPKDKKIVLGLITTKTPQLENPDELKRRIDEASKYVPLENLCLSPQCGFASEMYGNKVTINDEKAKLSLVVKVASEVWGTAS
ncbi:MAG: 5-methyltetrahydropteroyltriglutamate--homocysteine S-methyltransferase [Deltaproteobacteria bacterium]|nr:5-methyltetrahydropteroyltriglutamate--homocysteine S-methyltransferase [Deltaproteobacteria bacterium]